MPQPIVVASVPAGHPYVARLGAPGSPVVRLPDPDPDDPTRVAGARWWPPVMLRADWAESAEADLLHVHFGFEGRTPAELAELVAVLRRRRRPLVLTVHDLHSPHQADPTALTAQLDVLVPAAAAVITLTPSAARRIRARWGREATVLPHPHVVDLDAMERLRARRSRRPAGPGQAATRIARVGIAVKDLRANCRPEPLVAALAGRDGVRLVVSVHRTLTASTEPRAQRLAADLHRRAADGALELVEHDRLADTDLWEHVAGLDVAVLPYAFGTHSGWLEMCHDVGTSVVAPDFGCYADQGADAVYSDAAALPAAVEAALATRAVDGLPGLDAPARAAQQRRIAARHDAVYAAVLAGAAGAGAAAAAGTGAA